MTMNLGRPSDQPFADVNGSVLGSERIRELAGAGWLFEDGSWSEDRIRPACYDLVVAGDELRITDPDDPEKMIEYGVGNPFPDSAIHLAPGDFAFVTTKERLCMPWTVAGNIGIRNRFARKGLLVLTGLLVDPGYGLELVDGTWAKQPKRLHFGIANVGRRAVNIVPERDSIASAQFVIVDGRVWMKEVSPPTDDATARGFVLFADFEKQLSSVDREVVETRASTQNVVIFGLYLLLATLVGAVTAIVLGAVSNTELSDRLNTALKEIDDHLLAAVLVTVVLAAVAIIVAGIVMWPLTRLLVRKRK